MGLRNKENEKEIADGDFWVRFWIGLWLLIIFIQYFESFAVDRFLVQLILSYFFIKRHNWAKTAVIFLSCAGFLILFTASWITRNEIGLAQHLFWWFYGVFYLAFFIFLLAPSTKSFFKSDLRMILPENKKKKIVFQVRICASIIFLIGIIEALPLHELKRYGVQTDGLLAIYCGG